MFIRIVVSNVTIVPTDNKRQVHRVFPRNRFYSYEQPRRQNSFDIESVTSFSQTLDRARTSTKMSRPASNRLNVTAGCFAAITRRFDRERLDSQLKSHGRRWHYASNNADNHLVLFLFASVSVDSLFRPMYRDKNSMGRSSQVQRQLWLRFRTDQQLVRKLACRHVHQRVRLLMHVYGRWWPDRREMHRSRLSMSPLAGEVSKPARSTLR